LNKEEQFFTIPIPRIFHSFFHEGMFPACSVCDKKLLEDGVSYFIEKAYQRGEVAFEYAMCDECRMSMGEDLSVESMLNLANYFMEHGDLLARRIHFWLTLTTLSNHGSMNVYSQESSGRNVRVTRYVRNVKGLILSFRSCLS
jgi:hypothetical protein